MNIESRYKAASIIFYRYKYIPYLDSTVVQVYLQYEKKYKSWSHFGGKREVSDYNSLNTALREFMEETTSIQDMQIPDIRFPLFKHYFLASKMIVYCAEVKKKNQGSEANWMIVDYLPSNIRPHVRDQIKDLFGYKSS